jgi:hypothetical protein
VSNRRLVVNCPSQYDRPVPSFERDIKPLFRPNDRLVMDFFVDLWSYDDVRDNAAAILDRVDDGTMPCDGPWDDEKIERFRAWTNEGCEE